MDWETSNRDKMLEALKEVLEGIEGVRHVNRQDVKPEMVADQQLPAIIIDEAETSYDWQERHGGRHSQAKSGITLDLQARAIRRKSGANTSTVRELFVHRVISELADNATLNGTAKDAAHEFEVRYLSVDRPYVRALVVIQVDVSEVFDGRTKAAFEQAVVDVGPVVDDEEVETQSVTVDLEE